MERSGLRVLVVGNLTDAPFVDEQVASLMLLGFEVKTLAICGKGIRGYLKTLPCLKAAIKSFSPDIVHAHYGLSGLLANLQRRVPVVTTYHGSDIHSGGWILFLSRICLKLSKFNIFVSAKLLERSGYRKKNVAVIPCGVDVSIFYLTEKVEARSVFEFIEPGEGVRYVLFSGAFDNPVKNSSLALEAVGVANSLIKSEIDGANEVRLIELKGFSRQQVNLLLNSVDCLLMTSEREGSPMVIKEAMAVGLPVVSVDAGDVKELIGGTDGCFVAERNPESVAKGIISALKHKGKTEGRAVIMDRGLSTESTAIKIAEIYKKCTS